MRLLARTLQWLFVPIMLAAVLYWLLEDWLRDRPVGTIDFEEES